MIKHTVFAIGIGMLVLFLYLFQYTGAFKKVLIATDTRGPYNIIYKDYVGPYHKIVSTIEEVETWAKSQGLKCRLSFGEYFDNPDQVEEGRLRARGGCLVEAEEKTPATLPNTFQSGVIPSMKAVVALFDGAPGIGPIKVYPKAADYIIENKLIKKGSVLEIYEIFDSRSMQTTYIWPVD